VHAFCYQQNIKIGTLAEEFTKFFSGVKGVSFNSGDVFIRSKGYGSFHLVNSITIYPRNDQILYIWWKINDIYVSSYKPYNNCQNKTITYGRTSCIQIENTVRAAFRFNKLFTNMNVTFIAAGRKRDFHVIAAGDIKKYLKTLCSYIFSILFAFQEKRSSYVE